MSAFSRSKALFAAISAIMVMQNTSECDKKVKPAALPAYHSRGKGGRKTPRTFSGVARARRQAKKLHNSK